MTVITKVVEIPYTFTNEPTTTLNKMVNVHYNFYYKNLEVKDQLSNKCYTIITCSCSTAGRHPPRRREETVKDIRVKESDFALNLQEVEHEGKEYADREEKTAPQKETTRTLTHP